jgi:hypothetical protein
MAGVGDAENNNQLTVSVALPAEPAASQELFCAAQQE